MPFRLKKSILLGINSHKILISSPVISQHLVNFKKDLEINLPKTLRMEDNLGNQDKVDKVDKMGKVDRTGVGKVVKTVKDKIKVKVGLVIIMALMNKDGQEIMDLVTKAGVAIMEG